jgi:hypothetical protein
MVLRVTLEIVPWGDETKKYKIGQLDIFNNDQLTDDIYEYGIIDLGNNPGLFNKKVWHLRSKGAWDLVRKVIELLEIKGP